MESLDAESRGVEFITQGMESGLQFLVKNWQGQSLEQRQSNTGFTTQSLQGSLEHGQTNTPATWLGPQD